MSTPEQSTVDETLAVETRMREAFRAFWDDDKLVAAGEDSNAKDSIYNLDAPDEGQYYRMAQLFASAHGQDQVYARRLSNYEIHRGVGAHSAEFRLLASPSPSDALLDGFSIYFNEPFETTIRRSLWTPDQPVYHNALEEHRKLSTFHDNNPELFWSLVLTRTVGAYTNIQNAENATWAFLDSLTDPDIRAAELGMSPKEAEVLSSWNLRKAELLGLERHMIEQLVRDGVSTVGPEQYYGLIQTYFVSLIKQDEDRLNPYSSVAEHSAMPGEIAIKAYLENLTGQTLQ